MMDLFYFSPPQHAASSGVFEFEGAKIGLSNSITSVKKSYTDAPGGRIEVDETILEKMFAQIKYIEENEKMFLCDMILHGVRVRLMANSRHLSEFFTDNFYNPREYSEQVQTLGIPNQGSIVPFRVNVYAINGIFDNVPLYCYNSNTNTIYIFNCSFYKVAFHLIMDAVAKILREDRGFFVERSMTLEKNKAAVVMIGCRSHKFQCESKNCNACFKTINAPGVKLQSLDYSVFRIAFHEKSGERLISPIKIALKDDHAKKGIDALEYLATCLKAPAELEKNGEAIVTGLTQRDEKVEIPVKSIDFEKPAEIFSYSVFKNYYQHTDIIEHYPMATYQFLHSKLENIPEITQEYIISNGEYLESFVRNELRNAKDASIAKYFNSISEEDGKKYVARFECFDESHVMIDYSKIFGKTRVYSNPLEAAEVKTMAVMEFKQDSDIKDAVFLKNSNFINKLEPHSESAFLKTLSMFSKRGFSEVTLGLYDNITGTSEEKPFNKKLVEECCMKKTFEIQAGSQVHIDGSNYEAVLPPPPPPPQPKPGPQPAQNAAAVPSAEHKTPEAAK